VRRSLLAALGTPDLRRLQVSWSVSAAGAWVFFVVLAIYAYDVGGATAVGVAALVRMLPAGIAAPFAGLLVDRHSRRVILEGRVVVERDGTRLADRARGDFFGELAALDWGAGFGYARLATVTATEPLRLLVLAPAHLARLMAENPGIDEQVRRAVRERLPTTAD
jgi:MFS family permease